MNRLTFHQATRLREVLTDDALFNAAVAALEKPDPRPLTQQDYEVHCKELAGYDAKHRAWPAGTPRPLKMRMRNTGEEIVTGWQNVARALANGLADLVE